MFKKIKEANKNTIKLSKIEKNNINLLFLYKLGFFEMIFKLLNAKNIDIKNEVKIANKKNPSNWDAPNAMYGINNPKVTSVKQNNQMEIKPFFSTILSFWDSFSCCEIWLSAINKMNKASIAIAKLIKIKKELKYKKNNEANKLIIKIKEAVFDFLI